MVTWKKVQEVILNEMGQSLSEDMCRNLAEQFNEPETSAPCHATALLKPATYREWNCTPEVPCEACQNDRPHGEDEGFFDHEPDGRTHKVVLPQSKVVATVCGCAHCADIRSGRKPSV